jgi:hypothetical protein
LRLVERYRRRDAGHLDVQMTLEDPQTFTKPVVVKFAARVRPVGDLIEYYCTENERDLRHVSIR